MRDFALPNSLFDNKAHALRDVDFIPFLEKRLSLSSVCYIWMNFPTLPLEYVWFYMIMILTHKYNT